MEKRKSQVWWHTPFMLVLAGQKQCISECQAARTTYRRAGEKYLLSKEP